MDNIPDDKTLEVTEPDGLLEDLPEACLAEIEQYLDTISIVNLKRTSRRFNIFCVISLHDKLVLLLIDMICNVGNNYDISTVNDIVSHALTISYLLNIYINSAIFFQKVKTHNGIVLYVRLMTIDRRNVDRDNVVKIVKTFMESQPVVAHGCSHFKVNRFVSLVNNGVVLA